jgi:hypothetical protein
LQVSIDNLSQILLQYLELPRLVGDLTVYPALLIRANPLVVFVIGIGNLLKIGLQVEVLPSGVVELIYYW